MDWSITQNVSSGHNGIHISQQQKEIWGIPKYLEIQHTLLNNWALKEPITKESRKYFEWIKKET